MKPLQGAASAFADTCAGCHGAGNGRAPDLFADAFLAARTDEQLHAAIANGVAGSEMPPFREMLADDQIWQMVSYLRMRGIVAKVQGQSSPPDFVPDPRNEVIRTARQTFRIDVVAAGLDTPWGMAFLPDGRTLVTERPGRLRIIDRNGKLLPDPVRGTPAVFAVQDGGMLDVAAHPDYRRNGWIYLAYTEAASAAASQDGGGKPAEAPSMTVIVRGQIDRRGRWVKNQEIFRAPAAFYTSSGVHYGSRLLFDGKGHLFFSIGDRGEMRNAQRLDTPLGKIHRVNDDGSVPADNPFVGVAGAVPTIWSYGHRNPQGLAFDPSSGLLWESEHGPIGGDEINIIEKGRNYGWGVVSLGFQPGIERRSAPDMVDPVAYYSPSIAPSGIGFYAGDRYPGWKGNLFVAGLAGLQLRRLEIEGRKVVGQEVLFSRFGRTRAVRTGPDGLLYVLLQNPTGAGTDIPLSGGAPGMLVRLAPQP
ncbi:MAG: PQQ-dependent sugar dehydrogenase [Sphingobium sp.]